jgi:plasmid stabilization system protein ParE
VSYRVTVAEAAEQDIFEIVEYIFVREGEIEPGLRVQQRLERAIASLSSMADRGRRPPELRRIGVEDFRELIDKPWNPLQPARQAGPRRCRASPQFSQSASCDTQLHDIFRRTRSSLLTGCLPAVVALRYVRRNLPHTCASRLAVL